jgi:cytochrome c1
MISMISSKSLRALVVAAAVALSPAAASAAGDEAPIERQKWSFGGLFGQYDTAQLQRGYQIYKDVCAVCHSMNRLYLRNLVQPGGPAFPEPAVKALAASFKVEDGPNEAGKMFTRPGRLTDRFPSPFKNEQEARSIHNGAYPPDLSLIARARNVEYHGPWYLHPFSMLRDVVNGYQEGGADYTYALLTGYTNPPADKKLADNMHWNRAFPDNQIAMAPPITKDNFTKYQKDAGAEGSLDQNARDVVAFLAWAADPHLDARKSMGWRVLIYLLVTTLMLYLAKRRLWASVH